MINIYSHHYLSNYNNFYYKVSNLKAQDSILLIIIIIYVQQIIVRIAGHTIRRIAIIKAC